MSPWIWAILLLVLACGLAVMEIFFPSAGILGFLSAVALLAAVVMGFQHGAITGILVLLGALVGIPTVIVLGFKYWPRTAMGRRVLLTAPTSDEVLPNDPQKHLLKSYVGRVGKAKTKMLLSGIITVDGTSVDAVSEGMPVEVGQLVRVIHVRGHVVVVRPLEEGELSEGPADPLQRTYDDPFEEQ